MYTTYQRIRENMTSEVSITPEHQFSDDKKRITDAILRKSLSSEFGVAPDKIHVESCDITSGSEIWDNFACVILTLMGRAKIDGGANDDNKGRIACFNYIAKVVPTAQWRELFIMNTTLYSKEVDFYTNLIHKLNAIRDQTGLNKLSVPKCYYASNKDRVIIMANLKTRGFQLAEKDIKGLHKEKVKLALEELATLHATTYHFLQLYPGGMDQFMDEKSDYKPKSFIDLLSEGSDKEQKMFSQILNWNRSVYCSAIDILKVLSDDDDLVNKMEAYRESYIEKANVDKILRRFKVIIHGDFWYNNMMFSYNNNSCADGIMLIDFQFTRVGSPAVDLAYFLTASTSPNLRKTNLDIWLKWYHDSLVKNFIAFGYSEDLYPMEELKADLKFMWPFSFMTGIMHSQIFRLNEDSKSDFDFNNMNDEKMENMVKMQENQAVNFAKNNPEYVERIRGLAEEARENNVI